MQFGDWGVLPLCILGDGGVEGYGDISRLVWKGLGFPARLQELIDRSKKVCLMQQS